MVIATEKSGKKRVYRIHVKIMQCAGNNNPEDGGDSEHDPIRRPGPLAASRVVLFRRAAPGFRNFQRQEGKEQARYSGKEESGAPTVSVGNHSAHAITEKQSDGEAQHENGKCPGAFTGRIQISDEGVGGG